MNPAHHSAFHNFARQIASSRPGAWFFSHWMHRLDAIWLNLTRGRRTLSSLLAGVPTVIVSTVGAKTGRTRSVPLLCIRDPQHPEIFALIATNWGAARYPAWYFNLKAHPRVQCSIDGRIASYSAHEAVGEEYERFWKYAVDIYGGYARYKQRIRGRRIPILVMTPDV